MADKPLILALANPTPEIMPELARQARPDAMICTGRSDFPNQVNNVLCFPYIFRGALDCGARAINEEMKMAAVRAIAALAREEPSDVAATAYSEETPTFGPDFLIPSPFDPRLILRIAPAVAKAACDSGVATRQIDDMPAYVDRLTRFVFRSGLVMKPVFSTAKAAQAKRVIYADGEDERVLRAAQVVLEEGIAKPILIGRPHVVEVRLKRYGLRIRPGTDFELINPEDDPRYRIYVDLLIELAGRRGVTQEAARTDGAHQPDGDCRTGAETRRRRCHDLRPGRPLRAASAQCRADHRAALGRQRDHDLSTLSMLITQRGVIFLTDTHVTVDPTAEEIAEMTILAAEEIRRFGIEPKAALLSHLGFRLARFAEHAEDAGRRGDPEEGGARPAVRRRDACRHRAVGDAAAARLPAFDAEGRGQPAGVPQPRCGQHHADDGQADDGRAACRADPARHRQAGAHPDALGDVARRRQHDGDRRRRKRSPGAGTAVARPRWPGAAKVNARLTLAGLGMGVSSRLGIG